MVRERAFGMAAESLLEHAYLFDDQSLHSLVDAVCASYDLVQYNQTDDVTFRRKELVENLANCVSMTPNQAAFVSPSVALAFAFYPTTRRQFISWCCSSVPANLDRLFVDASYRDVAQNWPSYLPLASGHVHDIVLRDIYWGRDFDEHVVRFLRANLPPYAATWHPAQALTSKCHSLTLTTPVRPFLATLAEVARRGLLKRSNVSICGKLFHDDPRCEAKAHPNDGILVARTLNIDTFLAVRICPHFGMTGVCSRPSNAIEVYCAAELLIYTLEPLRLPPYVLLEITEWLLPLSNTARFIRNVSAVYALTERIRASKQKRLFIGATPHKLNTQ